MRLYKSLFLGMTAALILCAGGCTARSSRENVPITVAINDDIVSLDPSGTKDVLSESLARCVFDTLYIYDENLNMVPSLAEKAERVSELEWVVSIRDDASFHDGTPLTARDVQFSIERAKTVERAEKLLLVLDRIDVVDPYTVHITTAEPCADISSIFVRVSTSIMSEKAMQNPSYNIDKPVGSGPFKVIERVPGKSIRMERFDAYFSGPAKVKYLTFEVEPSEQNRTAGLLNERFDVVFRISPNDCDYLKLSEKVRVYEHNSTKMEILSFNPDAPPLNDIRVREAISCAINKQNVVDNVVSGYGVPLNGMLPAPLMGAVDYEGFTYDPDRARALLDEAGCADSLTLNVLTFDEVRKKMMEYIKLDLAQVGIQLNYEFLQLSDYLDAIRANEYMATVLSWTSNADPDSTFTQLFTRYGDPTVNHSKFTDPQVEKLIFEARKKNDPDKRRHIYEEANRIIASTYFVLPLYQSSVLAAAGKNVGGVSVNPQGLFAYKNLHWIEP